MSSPRPAAKTFDRSLVEGPIGPAVWKLAWPTMLQNIIGGLQGVIDHALVGHFVGYAANAAIGVSWQIDQTRCHSGVLPVSHPAFPGLG